MAERQDQEAYISDTRMHLGMRASLRTLRAKPAVLGADGDSRYGGNGRRMRQIRYRVGGLRCCIIDYDDLASDRLGGGAAQRFCLLSNTGLQRKEQ